MGSACQAEIESAESITSRQLSSNLLDSTRDQGVSASDQDFSSMALQHEPITRKVGIPSKKILLVEDNDDLREVVRIYLSIMGFSVVACCDAQVASSAFHSQAHFDALMSDLEMPGRSGLELARELTTIRPALPVMIVSGAFVSDDMSLEMRQRDWRFLPKPCGLPSILATLQAILAPLSRQVVA